MGQRKTEAERRREFERDLQALEANARRTEYQELLLRALATGADHAHLVWRALRPELIAARLIAPVVHFLPSGQRGPYTPAPAPEHPPRLRPPLGQELHDFDQALAMCEELDPRLNRRQLEVLEDVARRVQKLYMHMNVRSRAALEED